LERKKELEHADRARRKREESVSGKRKAFAASLEDFFVRTGDDRPKQDVAGVVQDVERELTAIGTEKDVGRAAAQLIEVEAFAEQALGELRKSYSISRPRDIGLSSKLRREWEGFVAERDRLETDVFSPAAEQLQNRIAAVASQTPVDQRRRVQTLVGELASEAQKTIQAEATEARRTAEQKCGEVRELAQKAIAEVKNAVDAVNAELQRTNVSDLAPKALERFRTELERQVDVVASRHRELLESARRQLLDMHVGTEAGDEPAISTAEMTGAIEEEVLALREAADADAELIQLGMALAVVSHEFDAVIRVIRDELRRLKRWADASPQLRPIHARLQGNFEHLDGYLTLFTPLQRRLYRKPQRITGAEIRKFLEDLFQERLRRHAITVTASPQFESRVVTGYPSTFFPVFVNIIDNAIFWLKDHRSPRSIALAADDEGFLIANNGPRINSRDRETIFDLRFTRKPGGRGMGLYISRHTLAKAGYRLTLEQHPEFAVCFKIAEEQQEEEHHEP